MTWVPAGLELVDESDGVELDVDLRGPAILSPIPTYRLRASMVELETGRTQTIAGRFVVDPDEEPWRGLLTRTIGRRPTKKHLDYLRGLRDACDRVLSEYEGGEG